MRPAKAVLEFGGRCAFLIIGPRAYALVLPGLKVVPDEDTEIAATVRDVRVAGLRHRVGALAIRYALPIGDRNRSAARRAGSLEGAFVLLRAVDVVGELIVEIYVVELPRRLIVLVAPRLPAVGRDGRSAVIAFQDVFRIVGIDPCDMVVAVGRL